MIDKSIQEVIVNTITKDIEELKLITLFGSVNTPYYDQNKSDIDIAFLSPKMISNIQRWDIQEKLASILNTDIDLVDLNNSNDILRFEVISKGKSLFINPSYELEIILDSIYINYIQLNEDRAEIIQAYT